MAVQAWIILTEAERNAALELNADNVAQVRPRIIDNEWADNLGEGALVGKFVAPARILNDPESAGFWDLLRPLPIRTMDSDMLFAPAEV